MMMVLVLVARMMMVLALVAMVVLMQVVKELVLELQEVTQGLEVCLLEEAVLVCLWEVAGQ